MKTLSSSTSNLQFQPPPPPPQPSFFFRRRNERLDWRQIASLDLDKLIQEGDTESLENFILPVLFSRAEIEFDESRGQVDPGFIKVFRISQLIGEYLLHCQEKDKDKLARVEITCHSLEEEKGKVEKELAGTRESLTSLRKELKKTKDMLASTQTQLLGSENLDETDQCPYCNKHFLSPYLLLGHLQRRHQGLTIPLYLQNMFPLQIGNNNGNNNGKPSTSSTNISPTSILNPQIYTAFTTTSLNPNPGNNPDNPHQTQNGAVPRNQEDKDKETQNQQPVKKKLEDGEIEMADRTFSSCPSCQRCGRDYYGFRTLDITTVASLVEKYLEEKGKSQGQGKEGKSFTSFANQNIAYDKIFKEIHGSGNNGGNGNSDSDHSPFLLVHKSPKSSDKDKGDVERIEENVMRMKDEFENHWAQLTKKVRDVGIFSSDLSEAVKQELVTEIKKVQEMIITHHQTQSEKSTPIPKSRGIMSRTQGPSLEEGKAGGDDNKSIQGDLELSPSPSNSHKEKKSEQLSPIPSLIEQQFEKFADMLMIQMKNELDSVRQKLESREEFWLKQIQAYEERCREQMGKLERDLEERRDKEKHSNQTHVGTSPFPHKAREIEDDPNSTSEASKEQGESIPKGLTTTTVTHGSEHKLASPAQKSNKMYGGDDEVEDEDEEEEPEYLTIVEADLEEEEEPSGSSQNDDANGKPEEINVSDYTLSDNPHQKPGALISYEEGQSEEELPQDEKHKKKKQKHLYIFDSAQGKLIDAAETKSQLDLVRDRLLLTEMDERLQNLGIESATTSLGVEEMSRALRHLKSDSKRGDEDPLEYKRELDSLRKSINYEATIKSIQQKVEKYENDVPPQPSSRLTKMLRSVKKSGSTWKAKVASVLGKGKDDEPGGTSSSRKSGDKEDLDLMKANFFFSKWRKHGKGNHHSLPLSMKKNKKSGGMDLRKSKNQMPNTTEEEESESESSVQQTQENIGNTKKRKNAKKIVQDFSPSSSSTTSESEQDPHMKMSRSQPILNSKTTSYNSNINMKMKSPSVFLVGESPNPNRSSRTLPTSSITPPSKPVRKIAKKSEQEEEEEEDGGINNKNKKAKSTGKNTRLRALAGGDRDYSSSSDEEIDDDNDQEEEGTKRSSRFSRMDGTRRGFRKGSRSLSDDGDEELIGHEPMGNIKGKQNRRPYEDDGDGSDWDTEGIEEIYSWNEDKKKRKNFNNQRDNGNWNSLPTPRTSTTMPGVVTSGGNNNDLFDESSFSSEFYKPQQIHQGSSIDFRSKNSYSSVVQSTTMITTQATVEKPKGTGNNGIGYRKPKPTIGDNSWDSD